MGEQVEKVNGEENKSFIDEKVLKLKQEFVTDPLNYEGALICAGNIYKKCLEIGYPIPSREKLLDLVITLAAVHSQQFDYIERELIRLSEEIIKQQKDKQ